MKPDWMQRNENSLRIRFRRCIDCKHVGDPCGKTNYMGSGKGREVMYQCRLHPTVKLYSKTYACTDFEHR